MSEEALPENPGPIQKINHALKHVKRVATIGGLQYAIDTYLAAFTCTSTKDEKCFRDIALISRWVGTTGGLVVAVSALSATLYSIVTQTDKPRALQLAGNLFEKTAGFVGGHVNYLIIISAITYQIIIAKNPDINPAQISISTAEFIGIISGACLLAGITMPDLRYGIRELYLKNWKDIDESIEQIPRGTIAKILDITAGYISQCADWFGMLSAIWGVVNGFSTHKLTFPFYSRLAITGVIALEGATKNYFLAPPEYVQNPTHTSAQLKYLNISNAIKECVGTLCFMMLLDSAVFFHTDKRDFKTLSICFYTLLVIIWANGLLNYYFSQPKAEEQNRQPHSPSVSQNEKGCRDKISECLSQCFWANPEEREIIHPSINDREPYTITYH